MAINPLMTSKDIQVKIDELQNIINMQKAGKTNAEIMKKHGYYPDVSDNIEGQLEVLKTDLKDAGTATGAPSSTKKIFTPRNIGIGLTVLAVLFAIWKRKNIVKLFKG